MNNAKWRLSSSIPTIHVLTSLGLHTSKVFLHDVARDHSGSLKLHTPLRLHTFTYILSCRWSLKRLWQILWNSIVSLMIVGSQELLDKEGGGRSFNGSPGFYLLSWAKNKDEGSSMWQSLLLMNPNGNDLLNETQSNKPAQLWL